MNFMQVLSEFLANKFPFWGVCHLNFDPNNRTLYIRCRSSRIRTSVLKDASELIDLDIGIYKFVVTHPDHCDIIIQPSS